MEMIDVLKKLTEIAETKPELVKDAVANVQATNPQAVVQNAVQSEPAMKTDEGGMSDIHIGAQEALGEFQDEEGNLTAPKKEVVAALVKKSKEVSFPTSYEYEVAARMAADEYNDAGQKMADMEPAMDSEQPTDEGNAFAQAVQKAKAAGMKKGDKFKVGDEEHTLRDSDFEVNTDTMKTEDKKQVNEDIKISADTPQEAGMMMQILKLAGVQPVDAKMMGAEPEENPPHGEPGHQCSGDDAMGSMDMAKMRDMVTAPDEEKAEETFDNEPDVKVQDTDTLVNTNSGGLNRKKVQIQKGHPGDNELKAFEDTVTEEDLANSLRAQYEGFKKEYQEAAKVAEAKAKPDFLDMDKDGDKKEPMKKAIKDKEAK